MNLHLDIPLSEKQQALVEYLLERLGFTADDKLVEYAEYLNTVAYKQRLLRAVWPDDITDDTDLTFFWFDGEKHLPISYSIVDFLMDEYILKKQRNLSIKNYNQHSITASGLANFVFCPVSYAIGETFDTRRLESGEIGEELHKIGRLINFLGLDKTQKAVSVNESVPFYGTSEKSLYNDLKQSSLIFSDHTANHESKEVYFSNNKIGFVGKPDYVFAKNNGENFIVEEKFIKDSGQSDSYFFSNHKVQLASYIVYLDEIKASFGYLVYWFYDIRDKRPCYNRASVLKITNSSSTREYLAQAFSDLERFRSEETMNFNSGARNPKKCASCVHTMYCNHKTGRFEDVTLPYSLDFYQLYPSKYPDILKKEKVQRDDEGYDPSIWNT